MTETFTPDAPGAPGERVIPVDSEHFAIRLLVPILTIAATVLTHVVGLSLLDAAMGDDSSLLCILLSIDALVLLTAGMGIERILKRVLPSRRHARLSQNGLALVDARHNPPEVQEIDWNRTFNVSSWHFVVRRRTRVPKGWLCMALHVLQDDTELVLYTFMSPKDAQALPSFNQFVRLRPRKETETNTDLRQVATQRRLLKLEDARWSGGAEIASADFVAVLAQIEAHVPTWP